MRPLALLTAVLLAMLLAAPMASAAEAQVNPNEIEGEVMCPVCGTLLEVAESPQAQREKAFIKRLADEGKSKAEIKDALVAEYGRAVLALPQGSGFDLSAYLVPIIAFVVAAGALAFGVLRWRKAGGGGGPSDGDSAKPAGPSDADSERLDADLARYDL